MKRYRIKVEVEIAFTETSSKRLKVLQQIVEDLNIKRPGLFLKNVEDIVTLFSELGYPDRAIAAVPKFETTVERI